MVSWQDLVDIGDNDYSLRQGEYIECQDCGESFGGTRGDFFLVAGDWVFHCPECDSINLAVVKDIVETVIMKQ